MSEAYYQLQDATSAIHMKSKMPNLMKNALLLLKSVLMFTNQLRTCKYGDDAEEILAFQDKARDAFE